MTPDNRHLARIIVGLTRSGYAEDQINAVEELLNKYFPKVEDKKAPVLDEELRPINIKIHVSETITDGIARFIKDDELLDFYEELIVDTILSYMGKTEALQRSQERNRAIQECIDIILNDHKATAGKILVEFGKLKKDS